ncbi:MAG: Spo0B domain-containing protein [Desulfitobacteriaceae bacterium]
MSQIIRKLLAEQLSLYRLQRHDFLNHWQVIMGYLQLNNPSKALEYMHKALQGMQIEQVIGQIPKDTIVAILLGWVNRLRQEGINTTVSYPEKMKERSFWQDYWLEEYAEAFYGYTKECVESTSVVSNELSEESCAEIILEERLFCSFRFLRGGVLLQEKTFKLINGENTICFTIKPESTLKVGTGDQEP